MSGFGGAAHDPSTDGRPMTGWHALVWFAGFFAAMFAVNGVFLWTAVTTFPGEDVKKSYLTGLNYNDEINRAAKQAASGWRSEIGVTEANGFPLLQIRIEQPPPEAAESGTVTVRMRHPADSRRDVETIASPMGAGEFIVPLDGMSPGRWIVELAADIDPAREGPEFRARREVFLP